METKKRVLDECRSVDAAGGSAREDQGRVRRQGGGDDEGRIGRGVERRRGIWSATARRRVAGAKRKGEREERRKRRRRLKKSRSSNSSESEVPDFSMAQG